MCSLESAEWFMSHECDEIFYATSCEVTAPNLQIDLKIIQSSCCKSLDTSLTDWTLKFYILGHHEKFCLNTFVMNNKTISMETFSSLITLVCIQLHFMESKSWIFRASLTAAPNNPTFPIQAKGSGSMVEELRGNQQTDFLSSFFAFRDHQSHS